MVAGLLLRPERRLKNADLSIASLCAGTWEHLGIEALVASPSRALLLFILAPIKMKRFHIEGQKRSLAWHYTVVQ